MSRCLGSVELGDRAHLEELLNEVGYSLDFVDEYKYCDEDEVWEEARGNMAVNGTDSMEVRVYGLDYVEVHR